MAKKEFYVYSQASDHSNDIFIDWETLEQALNGKNYLFPIAEQFNYIGDYYDAEQAEEDYYRDLALAMCERMHP